MTDLTTEPLIDKLVFYIIVRELNISTGKIGAQIGHGVERMICNYLLCGSDEDVKRFKEWRSKGSAKVLLTADDKEWSIIKEQITNYEIIKDAGLTEIEPGTETVIVLPIIKKSERPKILKRLRPLK